MGTSSSSAIPDTLAQDRASPSATADCWLRPEHALPKGARVVRLPRTAGSSRLGRHCRNDDIAIAPVRLGRAPQCAFGILPEASADSDRR
jgi:hypothetical protein